MLTELRNAFETKTASMNQRDCNMINCQLMKNSVYIGNHHCWKNACWQKWWKPGLHNRHFERFWSFFIRQPSEWVFYLKGEMSHLLHLIMATFLRTKTGHWSTQPAGIHLSGMQPSVFIIYHADKCNLIRR